MMTYRALGLALSLLVTGCGSAEPSAVEVDAGAVSPELNTKGSGA